MRSFQLADLLTAGGAAMGSANLRLTASAQPALLRSYDMTLSFPGSIRINPGASGICVLRPTPSRCAAAAFGRPSILIRASYIAAPSLVQVPPT